MNCLKPVPPVSLPALFGMAGLALASCAASSTEFPLEKGAPYSQQVPSDSWLELATAAERRLEWSEAGMWLDRYATLPSADLDEDFWFRRAAVAEKGGDPFRAAEVRHTLLESRPQDLWLRIDLADDLQQTGNDLAALEVLDVPFSNPEDQVYAWSAMVELLLQNDRKLEAAALCEKLGAATSDAVSQEWWQRASSLYQKMGDLTRATICIEQALSGVNLAKEEQRVVQRLHAFELGQPENVADALMLLRHHTDPEMRLVGLDYLSRDRFPKDVGNFEIALRDPDARIVHGALEQLALRSERGRYAAVMPSLEHADPAVVVQALQTLGALGTVTVMPRVLVHLEPEDRARFRAARSAAEQITGHTIGLGMDPGFEERKVLALAWRTWWQENEESSNLER
ncbi:MAG: hypothetical protein ACYSU1_06855 [Planctomycetota bacterium]|jgi:tetratricopeptide (TPR) repeat protein